MANREPTPSCRCNRAVPVILLAAGTVCLAGALAVSGGVAALLLSVIGEPGAGDCTGALILPLLSVAASAVVGFSGIVLNVAAGVAFLRQLRAADRATRI